jgi:hypothetical protein
VRVDDDVLWFHFRKIAVNVVSERPGGPNVLPTRMRRWFGVGAGLPGTHHEVQLTREGDHWQLGPVREAQERSEVIPFPALPFFENLRVACGAAVPLGDLSDQQTTITVSATVPLDSRRHFVVRAEGDSMDGGERPIADGDLVLCAWADVTSPEDVQGRICLLSGIVGGELASAQIKVPIRRDGQWYLRSANPAYADASIDAETTLRVVARVLEAVEPAVGLERFATYDRATIATQFGATYSRSWQQGHIDLELHGRPHTVLLVTLEKSADMVEAYHYADRFVSPTEFQWESQNQTRPDDKRGQAIIAHRAQGRTIHLFIRYHGKTAEQKGEPFVYCGTVQYRRHQGEAPIRVWFDLDEPLPPDLYRAWTG